ncbi:MAG: 23S rRNA (guanosine(2251)-2'-O)-methyltransferase RlmB [Spirochaetales bacterium]|nr:23S rRNA (guanosine(2251)-2'-O)-methyltransferase RlmB [Spirochaetales bacterium]
MQPKPSAISGLRAVEEALRAGAGGVLFLSRRNPRTESLSRLAESGGVPVVWTDERTLARKSAREKTQGAVLEVRLPTGHREPGLSESLAGISSPQALILLLDGITDPHNLGAILRSADQLAVELVVVTARRSARETETVFRTSAGASAYVSLVTVANLSQAAELAKRQEFWVYGADVGGQRMDQLDLRGRVALVLGSEGAGLHRLVRERCDQLVRIPSAGHVDSFNVSVAAGILMFEVRRQQGFPSLR